jgi:phosphonate transport system ATP-binding protein
VGGVPLTRETVGRVRARVSEVDLRLPVAERRSLLWNTLAGSRPGLGALQGFVRLARPGERRAAVKALHSVGLPERARDAARGLDREERARLALARALLRRPEHLVVREVDLILGLADAERLLDLLRAVARADRLSVAASVASLSLARRFADRVVVMADGLLVFDAPPHILSEDEVGWRLRRRAPSSVTRY